MTKFIRNILFVIVGLHLLTLIPYQDNIIGDLIYKVKDLYIYFDNKLMELTVKVTEDFLIEQGYSELVPVLNNLMFD